MKLFKPYLKSHFSPYETFTVLQTQVSFFFFFSFSFDWLQALHAIVTKTAKIYTFLLISKITHKMNSY